MGHAPAPHLFLWLLFPSRIGKRYAYTHESESPARPSSPLRVDSDVGLIFFILLFLFYFPRIASITRSIRNRDT